MLGDRIRQSLDLPVFLGCGLHGRVSAGVLTKPNNQTVTIPAGSNRWGLGSTNLHRVPGLPAVSRNSAQQAFDAANGHVFKNIAQSGGGRLHGASLGNAVLYIDSRGRPWQLQGIASFSSGGGNLTLQATAKRFGYFPAVGSAEPTTVSISIIFALGTALGPGDLMDYSSAGSKIAYRHTVDATGEYVAVEWILSDDGAVTPTFSATAHFIHAPGSTTKSMTVGSLDGSATASDLYYSTAGEANSTVSSEIKTWTVGSPADFPGFNHFAGSPTGDPLPVRNGTFARISSKHFEAGFVFANYDENDNLAVWTLDATTTTTYTDTLTGGISGGFLVQKQGAGSFVILSGSASYHYEETQAWNSEASWSLKRNGVAAKSWAATTTFSHLDILDQTMEPLSAGLSIVWNMTSNTGSNAQSSSSVVDGVNFPVGKGNADIVIDIQDPFSEPFAVEGDRAADTSIIGWVKVAANKVLVPSVSVSDDIRAGSHPGPFNYLSYIGPNGSNTASPTAGQFVLVPAYRNASCDMFSGTVGIAGAGESIWFI